MIFKNSSFVGTTIILDGNEYSGCSFEKCKIVVTRGNYSLHSSTFDRCDFEFGGEAANIKELVTGLLNPQKSTPQKKGTNG